MAKFHSYYVLCPLIDQKSFLGVSRDKDDENVVVTLGRNVVNKHRVCIVVWRYFPFPITSFRMATIVYTT